MNKYIKNLNRIEFVVTMACTGRCIHCSEGEHKSGGEHIDGNIAAQAVIDIVKYFAMCIKETGVEIKLNPAWLVSKEDDNEYNKKTKKIISEFEDLNIPQAKGNVIFPNGNAVKYLSEYFDEDKEYVNPYDEDPTDIRVISFSENGDVLNGNIYEKSIMEIIEEYKVYI